MLINVSLEGDVAVLGNFGGLLNDPKHFDVGRDVDELLDRGVRKFVLEMNNIREMGPTALGLMVTLTRRVRKEGGEVVLARPRRSVLDFLDEMRMDDFWDVAETVEAAKESFPRSLG
jgi:anti-sigma B factor antagonist